jgi:hypothetical protein
LPPTPNQVPPWAGSIERSSPQGLLPSSSPLLAANLLLSLAPVQRVLGQENTAQVSTDAAESETARQVAAALHIAAEEARTAVAGEDTVADTAVEEDTAAAERDIADIGAAQRTAVVQGTAAMRRTDQANLLPQAVDSANPSKLPAAVRKLAADTRPPVDIVDREQQEAGNIAAAAGSPDTLED